MNKDHIRLRVLGPEEVTQGKIFMMLSMVDAKGRLNAPVPAFLEIYNDEDELWYSCGVAAPLEKRIIT
jgi:hypothetical protein